MEAYQHRVIDERAEFNERIEKLTLFMLGDVAAKLPAEELRIMLRQHHYMVGYRGALDARIRRFNPS